MRTFYHESSLLEITKPRLPRQTFQRSRGAVALESQLGSGQLRRRAQTTGRTLAQSLPSFETGQRVSSTSEMGKGDGGTYSHLSVGG